MSPRGHTGAVEQLFFSGDGKRLISIGADRTAHVWNISSTKSIRTIRLGSSKVEAWAITPDSQAVIGVDERLVLHRWSLKSDRPPATVELREAQKLGLSLNAREIRIAPDGSLALLAWPRIEDYRLNRFRFSFWDSTTGRLLHWGAGPEHQLRVDCTRHVA